MTRPLRPCTSSVSAPASDMARSLALRVRGGGGGGASTGNERRRRRRREKRQKKTTGEKRETRLGRQKVTTHLSDEYPIPVYRRRHTDATNGENEIYGGNSIRPADDEKNINATHCTNDNRVHAHGRPRTAHVIRIRKIITTLENHTCPWCVYAIPFFPINFGRVIRRAHSPIISRRL